jgi:DNA-directed RNA polymerase subunit A'
VRHAGGQIIQFEYGEDGVDPSRSIAGKSVDVDRIIADIREGV